MKMFLKNILGFFLIILALNFCNGLECTFNGGALSFCQPGGNITLSNHARNKTVVLQNDLVGQTNGNCCNRIQCERANGCEGGGSSCESNNGCQGGHIFKNLKIFCNNHMKLSRCLTRYCRPWARGNSSCACTYHPFLSESKLNILCGEQLVNPVCLINLSEKESEGRKALEFICMWEKEYFGMNAALHLSHLDRDASNKCSTDENSIRANKLLPNAFLTKGNKTHASCTLTIPNRQPKSCNFSLYITPRISTIRVGESINVKCPQSSNKVTWNEIRGTQLISLESNISVVSNIIVSFHAATPNEDGFIIMCKEGNGNNGNVLGIGRVIVKEASRYLPSTASSADNDTVTNLNTTQSQVTTVTPPTEVLSISLISLSVAVVFSLGVCMLLIIYKSHNKRKRKQNDTNQQSDADNFQMSPQNDPCYENASQDVIMSSESTKNVCLHKTKQISSSKEHNSVPGNQRKLESADEGMYQAIPDDLAPGMYKEDDSTGQEISCRYVSTTHHSADSGENMYFTLEGPREDRKYQPLVSTPSGINILDNSGSTEDKQYEIVGLDDQHTYDLVNKEDSAGQEISCRNSSNTHHSADSGENKYFTLEGPSEEHKYQPLVNTPSDINPSEKANATEGKQYEIMDLDDQHLYAQVNNIVKSENGTPNPDSLSSASKSKDCRNVDSIDVYAELNKPGPSNGDTLQDNLPTRSVKLRHMESTKRQDLEDNGDGSTYDRLKRPLYEGPHSISE